MRVVNVEGIAILDAFGRLEGPVIAEGNTPECVEIARAINQEVDRLVYSAECQKIEHRPGKNSEEGKMWALALGLPETLTQVKDAVWLLNWGCNLPEALVLAELA